ncbi:hypothetical protein PV325_003776 [Microctonus aethiopoides]|nr:hypothetical protein PV325_003776 [Microctonus aethiopoides]
MSSDDRKVKVKEEKETSSMAPGSPPTPPHTPQSPPRQNLPCNLSHTSQTTATSVIPMINTTTATGTTPITNSSSLSSSPQHHHHHHQQQQQQQEQQQQQQQQQIHSHPNQTIGNSPLNQILTQNPALAQLLQQNPAILSQNPQLAQLLQQNIQAQIGSVLFPQNIRRDESEESRKLFEPHMILLSPTSSFFAAASGRNPKFYHLTGVKEDLNYIVCPL